MQAYKTGRATEPAKDPQQQARIRNRAAGIPKEHVEDRLFRQFPQNRTVTLSSGAVDALPGHFYKLKAIGVGGLASLAELNAILAPEGLRPLAITPWHGVAAVFGVDYEEVSLHPYKEIAVMLPAEQGRAPADTATNSLSGVADSLIRNARGWLAVATTYVPAARRVLSLPLLRGLLPDGGPQHGFYVWKMSTTTQLSTDAGRDTYGFPKEVGDLRIKDTPDSITFAAMENGKAAVQLRWRKGHLPGGFELPALPVWLDVFCFTPKAVKQSVARFVIRGRALFGLHGLWTPLGFGEAVRYEAGTHLGDALRQIRFIPLGWQYLRTAKAVLTDA